MRIRVWHPYIIVASALVFALTLDAWIKNLVVQHLARIPYPIGGSFIALMRIGNDAMAFSIGAGKLIMWVPFVLRFATLLLIVWLVGPSVRANHRFAYGLGILLAGGLGNVVDLVFRNGEVVDFLLVGQVRAWANEQAGVVFALNLADIWIFLGIGLLYPLVRCYALEIRLYLQRFGGALRMSPR